MSNCAEIRAGDFAKVRLSSPTRQLPAETVSGLKAIHQLFEAHAANRPDAVALISGDTHWTYDELNRRANQLAHFLRGQSVGPDSIVGLRAERSPELIAGILGILKAGGAYLPIDPAYPVQRQAFMVADAGVRWVLSQDHLPPLDCAASILRFNADWEKVSAEPDTNPSITAEPGNLAYLIYTSGSTGRPKGVMVSHGNLLHSTLARFDYYADAVANFLLLSSHAFDSSVAGIFWTLSQGGTLTLPREFSRQTASEVARSIAGHRVSHLLCLPSLYSIVLEEPAALTSLRVAIVAGESCPAPLVERHHAAVPHAALFNEYGPTEATVWATVHRCEPGASTGPVPIGRPIPGAQVHLLDEQGQPVRNGDAGEIYIGGPGVARGYLNLPELTAQKFVPDPFANEVGARLYRTGDLAQYREDGQLEFLGRADHQIKIRGHRVELEEIENVLRRHTAVRDAVVIARKGAAAKPVNGQARQFIERRLTELDAADADLLFAEIERQSQEGNDRARPAVSEKPESVKNAGSNGTSEDASSVSRRRDGFQLSLEIKDKNFIRPPREVQRTWLLQRALDEFSDDLEALDQLAGRFVPGADVSLETFTADRTQAELSEQEILEDWHIPLMKAMARAVTETHGDVLEIGFGRGLASTYLQQCGVRSHTIIECNHSVISRFFKPWREVFADRDVRLVRGKWQDVIDELGTFDGIFFQTFPLNEREFADYLSRSVTFAEHFFPTAARHLNVGGAFTYLTHEMDSLSRRHQRTLLRHFRSVTLHVEPLRLPADCRDLWWADSMVVLKAIK